MLPQQEVPAHCCAGNWFQICYEGLTSLSRRGPGGAMGSRCLWTGHRWPSASPESEGTVLTVLLRSMKRPQTLRSTGCCARTTALCGEVAPAAGGGVCIPGVQVHLAGGRALEKSGMGTWWAELQVSAPQILFMGFRNFFALGADALSLASQRPTE